ncbi:hypothetical protein [Bacillus cereus]|uniref:hypothetical protein n=1 Tax=Bacillus cereus TaxID=1396 RepID=UPI001076BDC5|nr:hypothetical protein [Bacillus cereus]TFZ14800.1 hypothetical protein C6Y54_00630 [Bacillus cereus]
MKAVSKRRLKKEYQVLQVLNSEFSGFVGNLGENHSLSEEEKKKIESMKQYFEHTNNLFIQLEKLVS